MNCSAEYARNRPVSVALATPTKSRESLGPPAPLPVRFRLRVVLVPVYSVGGAVVGLVPSLGEEEEEEKEEEVDEYILLLLPVGRVGKKAARAGRGDGAIRDVKNPRSPARANVELDARSSMTRKHAWLKTRKRRPPTAATGIYLPWGAARRRGTCTLAAGSVCACLLAVVSGSCLAGRPRLLYKEGGKISLYIV